MAGRANIHSMVDGPMIRVAGVDDLDAVLSLYRQLHRNDPVADAGAAREVWAKILGSPHLDVLVLEVAGSVVATCYLNITPNLTRGASPYCVIENVVVDEARRGGGLGKLLLADAVNRAWSAGCYKVMLATGSKTPATHAFYRAAGFDGTAKTSYVMSRPERT